MVSGRPGDPGLTAAKPAASQEFRTGPGTAQIQRPLAEGGIASPEGWMQWRVRPATETHVLHVIKTILCSISLAI